MKGLVASRKMGIAALWVVTSAALVPWVVFQTAGDTIAVNWGFIAPAIAASAAVWSLGSFGYVCERTAARDVARAVKTAATAMVGLSLSSVALGAWFGPDDGYDPSRATSNAALLIGLGAAVSPRHGSVRGALVAATTGAIVVAGVPELSIRAVARVENSLSDGAYLLLGAAVLVCGAITVSRSPIMPKTLDTGTLP